MSEISTAKMQTNFKKLRENWPLERVVDENFAVKNHATTKIMALHNKIEEYKKLLLIKDEIITALKRKLKDKS